MADMARSTPRRRGRRPAGSRILLRWLGVAVVAFVAFLYSQPLRSYLSTRDSLSSRSEEVRLLRAQKLRLEQKLANADTPGGTHAGGAQDRLREAGRAPLHRQGHRRLAPPARAASALAEPPRYVSTAWTTCSSSSASWGAAHAHSGASSCAVPSARRRSPSSRPTTRRATRSRRPTTSRARSSSPPSRGSRQPVESSVGARPRSTSRPSPRASPARPRSSAACAPSSPPESWVPTPEPRSTLASAAHEIPSSSSACTPTSPSRSRVPGYELGERIVAEIDPLWPRTCCMNTRGVAVSSGAP